MPTYKAHTTVNHVTTRDLVFRQDMKETGTVGTGRKTRPASLRVGLGEALAVIGPNGADKSSLLKLLAGEYRPDSPGRTEG